MRNIFCFVTFYLKVDSFNPIYINVSFLYLLKISENQRSGTLFNPWEYCKFFQNNYFDEHLQTVGSIRQTKIHRITLRFTAEKMKFSNKDFFSKYDQIWSLVGFGHIYWRNSYWKTSFFVQWLL